MYLFSEYNYEIKSRNTKTSGLSHNTCIKIDNSSFERVEDFIYLGKTLTNQMLHTN